MSILLASNDFHYHTEVVYTQLFLILILCCWQSHCFCNENFEEKKTKFYKCFFYNKTLNKSCLMKVDTEAKFQVLQLLQNKLFRFSIVKLRNIEFCSGKRTILPVTRKKRDRVALVGLPLLH